jgi:hypothetical protein
LQPHGRESNVSQLRKEQREKIWKLFFRPRKPYLNGVDNKLFSKRKKPLINSSTRRSLIFFCCQHCRRCYFFWRSNGSNVLPSIHSHWKLISFMNHVNVIPKFFVNLFESFFSSSPPIQFKKVHFLLQHIFSPVSLFNWSVARNWQSKFSIVDLFSEFLHFLGN